LVMFGVKTSQNYLSFETLSRVWRRAEKLGFDSAWLYDHFYNVVDKEGDCLECWTTLSALATMTERIRIGSNVTCNPFRYPSVLAKMVSTVDVISRGRVEFGIGAGWYELEAVSYGIPFASPPERVAQLVEAVQILKKMFIEEKATFKGRYYTVNDAYNFPKPIQKPNPPIYVGIGKGTRILPRLVADYADGVNLGTSDKALMTDILNAIKRRCKEIGRDYNKVLVSWEGLVFLGRNSEDLEAKLKVMATRRKKDVETVRKELTSSGSVFGEPDDVISGIEKLTKVGIQHFILHLGDYETDEPVETFAEHVINYFKPSTH